MEGAKGSPGSVSRQRHPGVSHEGSARGDEHEEPADGRAPPAGRHPDSLLALHEAGYRAVLDRIGPGASSTWAAARASSRPASWRPDRQVVGVDYSADAVATAAARYGPEGLRVARTNAAGLGSCLGSFDGACSSHLIEHFTDPEPHVAELARVAQATTASPSSSRPTSRPTSRTRSTCTSSTAPSCAAMLERHFDDVWLGGVDAAPHVKADFEARRVKANQAAPARRVRPAPPHPPLWYVWAYTRLLPLAYKLVARAGRGRGDRHHRRRLVRDRASWTTRRSCSSPSPAPRRGAERLMLAVGPDRRHRVGQVRRGRPAGRHGRRPHRRRPGGPRRRGPRWTGLPAARRPLRCRASWPPTGPSTARRWRRSRSPTRRPGWSSTPSPTPPSVWP